MDTKIEVKQELEPLSNDIAASQDATKSDVKTETACSQKEREFLPEDPVRKYNSDQEIDYKIDIKEEPWWLETEVSSVFDDIKDGDLTSPVKLPRLCTIVSGGSSNKSSLPSSENLAKDIIFYNGKNGFGCETQGDVAEAQPVDEHVYSEQSDKCSNGNAYNCVLNVKQKHLIHKDERPHKCNICEKTFTRLSHLKSHILIHEGTKPHKCQTCEKSFTRLSHLKSHILIHEGIKPHKCQTCEKSFTHLSTLKNHNLIHEGKRPHKCKTCEKSFTGLTDLKRHILIHEGLKPHKCENCEKSFTLLSNLKIHSLIHGGKKPHKCETCGKSFTWLVDFKRHNLIHEGLKPHKCEVCKKSFTQLSTLKKHNLIHQCNKTLQV